MRPYNPDVVTALIAERLAASGRGSQTRLAEALGVRVQTVNKWVQGQTCPEPDKWATIEQVLELAPGTIARQSGLTSLLPSDGDPDEDPVLSALNQDPKLSEDDRRYAIDLVKRLRQRAD